MNGVNPIVISKERALEEYNACKLAIKQHKTKEMVQLKKLYYHAFKGHKIMDIYEAFKFAGVNELKQPKLAIARADMIEITFVKNARGGGRFAHNKFSYHQDSSDVILPEKIFGDFWVKPDESSFSLGQDLKSKVPMIPVSKRNKDLKNYYILWEVEKWDIVPKDPILLKRMTKNLFVIIDKWNLTKLEQAIMNGR